MMAMGVGIEGKAKAEDVAPKQNYKFFEVKCIPIASFRVNR